MSDPHQDHRWERHADKGDCDYCPKQKVPVLIEPFGNKPACRECWELICYGDDE